MILKHLNDDLIAENIKQLQIKLCFPNFWDQHFENMYIIPFPLGDFCGDSIEKELQNLAVWIREKIFAEFNSVKTKTGKCFALGFLNYEITDQMKREFSISYTFDFDRPGLDQLKDKFNLDLAYYDDPPTFVDTIKENLNDIRNAVFTNWEDTEFENKFFFTLPRDLAKLRMGLRRFIIFMRNQIHNEFSEKDIKFGKLILDPNRCSLTGCCHWRLYVSYHVVVSKRKTTRDKIITNLKRNGTVFPYPLSNKV